MTARVPRYRLRTSMVRRGRQFESVRGLCKSPASRGFAFRIDLHALQYAVGMEPFMELSGPEPLCSRQLEQILRGHLTHDNTERPQGRPFELVPTVGTPREARGSHAAEIRRRNVFAKITGVREAPGIRCSYLWLRQRAAVP